MFKYILLYLELMYNLKNRFCLHCDHLFFFFYFFFVQDVKDESIHI